MPLKFVCISYSFGTVYYIKPSAILYLNTSKRIIYTLTHEDRAMNFENPCATSEILLEKTLQCHKDFKFIEGFGYINTSLALGVEGDEEGCRLLTYKGWYRLPKTIALSQVLKLL